MTSRLSWSYLTSGALESHVAGAVAILDGAGRLALLALPVGAVLYAADVDGSVGDVPALEELLVLHTQQVRLKQTLLNAPQNTVRSRITLSLF